MRRCPDCAGPMVLYTSKPGAHYYWAAWECRPCKDAKRREREAKKQAEADRKSKSKESNEKTLDRYKAVREDDPLDRVEGPVRPWCEEDDRLWMKAAVLRQESSSTHLAGRMPAVMHYRGPRR